MVSELVLNPSSPLAPHVVIQRSQITEKLVLLIISEEKFQEILVLTFSILGSCALI